MEVRALASMVSGLTAALGHLSGWSAIALIAALVFGETAIFLGFVLPGEAAVVFGGVLASRGPPLAARPDRSGGPHRRHRPAGRLRSRQAARRPAVHVAEAEPGLRGARPGSHRAA